MATDHEHSVNVSMGDCNALCEVCGDSVAITFEREGLSDPFQIAVEENLDLSRQLPADFTGNDYLPEALFEILRLNTRGWDPQSPFMARLLDRLPLPWLHSLAACGLGLFLASHRNDMFSVDGSCRLMARGADEEALDVGLDAHQVEDEVLEELGRNLTDFCAGDASVQQLKANIKELERSSKRMDAEFRRMEARLDGQMASQLSEAARVQGLTESNREHLARCVDLEGTLHVTTCQLVEFTFDRQWNALKQLESEASAILAKLNRMKESYRSSTPGLDACLAQWEEFQEQLTETGRRLLARKEEEALELKRGPKALPFRSHMAKLELPPKPPGPNFAAIVEEAKRRDRPSSGKSLSRSTSGGLSDSLASLNRGSHLASPIPNTSAADELLKRLNEMIPDIKREDLDRMLADLRVNLTDPSVDIDHLLQILTEKWFQ